MDTKTYRLHINPAQAEWLSVAEHPTSITTKWLPCTHPDATSVTLVRGSRYRAPAILHGQGCPPWLWRGIASTRTHSDALALGVHGAEHDGGPWIYLSGSGAPITAETPILICEVRSSREERALHAVEILRQAGLPADAEILQTAAAAATAGATIHAHHARQMMGIAVDRVTASLKRMTETQSLPKLPIGMDWRDVRAVVGDV